MRRRPMRPVLEALDARQLLSTFALQSAVVEPDGRTVQLSFTTPIPTHFGGPDELPGEETGVDLFTNTGTALEYIGAYATEANGSLTWTADYLIDNPSQAITFGQTGLKISAASGLLQDRFGNATSFFVGSPITNDSLVDASGDTTAAFTRGTGGVTVYVSSSHGTDSESLASAENIATPFATIEQALRSLFANGHNGTGSAVEILRGDTFTQGGAIQTGGQDPAHPFVMESYWNPAYGADPGTRPVISIDASPANTGNHTALQTNGGGGTPSVLNNVVIRNLDFEAINTSATGANANGLFFLQPGANWTLDNDVINNFNNNLVVEQGGMNGFNIIRDSITGSWGGQGILLDHVNAPLISQSNIDDNGHVNPDHTGATIFWHDIYIQTTSGPALVWGNNISHAGSDGLQMRPGGVMAYNEFNGDAIAGFVGSIGGTAYKNVVVGSTDIDLPNDPRGFGIALNPTAPGVLFGSLEFNVVVDGMGHQDQSLQLMALQDLKDAFVRYNTVVDGGPLYIQHLGTSPADSLVSVTNNLIDNGSGFAYIVQGSVDPSWYFAGSNAIASTGRYMSQIGNNGETWANWKTMTGSDANSTFGPITYAGPPSSVLTSVNSGMAVTGVFVPPDAFTIWADYAETFTPTNLPSLGTGPFDFYGASDYRAVS